MRLLTPSEVEALATEIGAGRTYGRPSYDSGVAPVTVEVPREYARCIALADAIAAISSPREEVIIWVTEHEIWSETATSGLFDQVRCGIVGFETNLRDTPAQVLAGSEFDEFFSLVLLCLLGRWDTSIILNPLDRLISLSHDGLVDVFSKHATEQVTVTDRLRSAGIKRIR